MFVVDVLLGLCALSHAWAETLCGTLVRAPSLLTGLLVDPRIRSSSSFVALAAQLVRLVCRCSQLPVDFMLMLLPHVVPTPALKSVWPALLDWAAPHHAALQSTLQLSLAHATEASDANLLKLAAAAVLSPPSTQAQLPGQLLAPTATLPAAMRLRILAALLSFPLELASLRASIATQTNALVAVLSPLVHAHADAELDAAAHLLEAARGTCTLPVDTLDQWRQYVSAAVLTIKFPRNASLDLLREYSSLLRLLLALISLTPVGSHDTKSLAALLQHTMASAPPPHRVPESLSPASFTELVAVHVRLRWQLIWYAVQMLPPVEEHVARLLLEACTDALDVAAADYLLPLYQIIDALVCGRAALTRSPDDAAQLMKALWHSFEQCKRKTAALVAAFVPLVLPARCYEAACGSDADAGAWRQLLEEMFARLLPVAERSPRIAHAVCAHLCALFSERSAVALQHCEQLVALCLLPFQLSVQSPLPDDIAADDTAGTASSSSSAALLVGAYLAGPQARTIAPTLIPALLDCVFTDELRAREYATISPTNKRKLSLWRALCILSHSVLATEHALCEAINERLWRALALKNHGNVRYYMQLFATSFLLRCPLALSTHFLPLLRRFDHEYQVATSLLIVGALVLLHAAGTCDAAGRPPAELAPHLQQLFNAIVPWTNHYHHAVCPLPLTHE